MAEQQRRQEAEARLVRLQENNQALARSNGRLQEQLARLRGEADLRQHEDGCARAAAAVRAREAAACIARLQTALQRAAADRAALMQQLEGKQQVIAYLEGKLAQQQGGAWCTAAPAEEGRSRGLQGASGRAAQQSALSSAASDGSRLRLGYAAAEAVSEQLQEEEEAHATGAEQEASSGSTPARPQGKEGPALLPDAAGGSRMAPASSSGAAASGEDPAAAPAGDPPSPPPGTAVQAPQTEATPQQQVLAPHSVRQVAVTELGHVGWRNVSHPHALQPSLPSPSFVSSCLLCPAAGSRRAPSCAPRCARATASATRCPA